MKTPNRLISLLVILFSTVVLNAQEGRWGPPPPRKVEEFKFTTPGYVKMMLDSFFTDLANNPSDQGHIIIYPKSESQRRGIEKVITGQIKTRNFDRTRVTLVRGPINTDGIIQLWAVPPGAEDPKPVLGEETEELVQRDESEYRPAPLPGMGTGADPKTRGTGTGIGNGSGDGTVKPEPGVGMAPRSGTDPILQTEMIPKVPGRPVVSDTPFRILSKPRPTYTEAARANNVQGTVTLKVTFLASGTIGSIVPVKSLPNGLTDQAVAAARNIRFEPETKNGVPITVTKIVPYSFTIY